MKLINSLVWALFVAFSSAAPQEDLVVDLPGLNYKINFTQYSGYLNASNGTYFHYWLTESQNNPSTDPLVLWLTGGPGCSSFSALFTENGPFSASSNGSYLVENPYSWNLVANMLFLESPMCVGFSYTDDSINPGCETDDEKVADMNYLALQDFFEKFPEYQGRDFYITGESYGGIYIPTLGVRVLEGSYPINFQGYAIGNGLLSYKYNTQSLIYFAYYHGLLGDKLWANLVKNCCNGDENPKNCNFNTFLSLKCTSLVLEAENIIYGSGLNLYNLYENCWHPETSRSSRYTFDLKSALAQRGSRRTVYEGPDCIDDTPETIYLNRQDVRQALHVPSTVQAWATCSDLVFANYQRTVNDVFSQIRELHLSKIRGLIYNGDGDMACNFLGDEWFIDQMQFPLVNDSAPWVLNEQVVGFVKYFDYVTFTTVKGSGHMVPKDKPGPALKILSSLINNKPL